MAIWRRGQETKSKILNIGSGKKMLTSFDEKIMRKNAGASNGYDSVAGFVMFHVKHSCV